MKKILLYIDCMQMGGANRVMANLANHYSNLGKDVVLINDVYVAEGKREYTISNKVKRMFLEEFQNCAVGQFEKNVSRIMMLRKIIKEENPDIVLSFMGPPNVRLLLSTIGLKTKKVVSVRNDPCREYGNGVKRVIANLLFRLADGCVFQTDDAVKYFGEKSLRSSCVIFNPVNPKFYIQEREVEDNHIVMVGRLQPQKNPTLMLEAFAKIETEFPQYILDYYGEGELQENLQQRARELEIEKKVCFHGQVGDIERVYKTASLFVMTSDFEGLPNALMEAMAVGVPVISTDCPCGGPRSLIVDKTQGILVSCGAVSELVDGLRKVLSDKDYRLYLGINAKNRAKAFRPELIFLKWDNYLSSVIKEN